MTDKHEDFWLTTDELIEKINSQPRGTRFYVCAQADGAESHADYKHVRACCATVPVSRKVMLEMASQALSKRREEYGSRIPCWTYSSDYGNAFYLF